MAGFEHLMEYGAWAIALGAGFEGETAAIAGGVMAHRGILTPMEAWLAIGFGAFTADELFFLLGRRFRDRPFVQRARAKPAFAKAIGFIERYPNAYVLIFRFLYGLRMVSPIAIGLTRMRWRRFAALNVVAAILWSAIFVTIGYLFGPAVDRLLASLAPYKTELMIAFPIPGTCFLIWLWWRKRREKKRAAQELSKTGPSIEAEA